VRPLNHTAAVAECSRLESACTLAGLPSLAWTPAHLNKRVDMVDFEQLAIEAASELRPAPIPPDWDCVRTTITDRAALTAVVKATGVPARIWPGRRTTPWRDALDRWLGRCWVEEIGTCHVVASGDRLTVGTAWRVTVPLTATGVVLARLRYTASNLWQVTR
jgi:hypothetical protein